MYRKHLLVLVAVSLAVGLAWAPWAFAQSSGRIEGRITREGGSGVSGVTVVLNETAAADITGTNGTFFFDRVPPGSYSLTFTLGDNTLTESGIEVKAGQTTRVEPRVDWQISFVETITVYSASRQTERVVDAPAAVTLVTEAEIERNASHGQLPKLLEFTPGAEVTQSGLYDYNLNTRGFNSSLNRRVATLIDGRNPAVPFLGAQEWAALSFPLNDIATLEMVRGPSAALYGANASSGILNIITKPPRYSQGGELRLTGGELSTTKADLRWASELGGDWYLKVLGGYHESEDFALSRNGQAEYTVPCTATGQTDCLPQERVPLGNIDDEITYGSLRLDKYLNNGAAFTLESGYTDIQGPVFQTGIGRVQLVEVARPWVRLNFSTDHWNVLGYYNNRDAPRQTALASGANLSLDTKDAQIEVQGNWNLADDRVRLVVGASYGEEDIDTRDPATGRQTLIFEPVESDQQAVFAQVDWSLSDNVKLVLAGRWDDSTLHDSQFSPKGSLVWSITPDHTLRFSYNEAFQVANYSEFFLQAPTAINTPAGPLSSVNLAAAEGICALGGVSCGFAPGPTRVLALGNEDLELEEIATFEVGYNAVLAGKGYLSIDYYNGEAEQFITDLLPQVGTALGRVNPNFGPYAPPAGLSPQLSALLLGTLQQSLGPLFPFLSTNVDGTPIFALASYTNFGQVDIQGVDVGLNYYFSPEWQVHFSYSWFDFDIKEDLPGFENLLLPNTPENKFSLGFTYVGERFDISSSYRWVDDFRWAVGPFQGLVESYGTADLTANYHISDHWSVGANVSNLFNNEHWESFGGDILERRALGYVAVSW